MKKILLLVAVMFLSILSSPILLGETASAKVYSCGRDSRNEPISTSIEFPKQLCNGEGASPVTAILLMAINFLAAGVVIAVIIGIIFGGFMYMTSSGDPNKAKQGREIIINAIIALVLFIFMFAIANFMIPGGLLTASTQGLMANGGYLI